MARITYVGHACLLIEIGGVRLLTDPVLRTRVGHLRRVAPALDPASVEGLDAALVSHAHHDHLDRPSLRMLAGRPPAICPAPAAGPVRAAGLEPVVLAPGETTTLGDVTVEATAAEHDGRRWPLPGGGGDAIGFLVHGDGRSIYFAGDTGPFEGMAAIGPVDVALLPVAGWGPRMGPGHLDPVGAAEAAVALGARIAVPIHWGTYERVLMRAGDPAVPARDFSSRLAELAPSTRVEILAPGESLDC